MAAGIEQINALAKAASCDAAVLESVIERLITKGVFERIAPGHFALNDAARALMEPAVRIGLDLEGIGGRMAYAWSTLPQFVRTGRPAYDTVFGRPFWEDLDAHPEIAASFDALIGMIGHGAPDPHFEISGGWSTVRSVVDVGGGTGLMLRELLRAHPHLHGTLVDLSRTVARAEMTDRMTVAGQSFFDPLPAGADLYLLRGVLNDWPDREAVAILRRCAEAARPTGRVVVLKSVREDAAPQPLVIEMVLAGGRGRTVAEFRQLAADAGLEVVSAGRQPAYFVVECRVA